MIKMGLSIVCPCRHAQPAKESYERAQHKTISLFKIWWILKLLLLAQARGSESMGVVDYNTLLQRLMDIGKMKWQDAHDIKNGSEPRVLIL